MSETRSPPNRMGIFHDTNDAKSNLLIFKQTKKHKLKCITKMLAAGCCPFQ